MAPFTKPGPVSSLDLNPSELFPLICPLYISAGCSTGIECQTNPVWVSSQVQDSPDEHQIHLKCVVDGIGKTLGQEMW